MTQSFHAAFSRRLVSLPPQTKLLLAVVADMLLLALAAALASRRVMSEGFASNAGVLVAWAPFLTITLLYLLKGYRMVVRFMGLEFIERAGCALFGAAAILHIVHGWLTPLGWPPHLLINYSLIGFALLLLSRILARQLLKPAIKSFSATNVLIYGAGSAGSQLAAALAVNARYRPVGFIDDRLPIQGRSLLGLTIHSPNHLPRLKAAGVFDQVLLAIPSASRTRRREILSMLERLPTKVLVMPGIEDLASGRKRVDDFQDVQIEDLLDRDPVAPIEGLLADSIRGKVVMVTGAGGSIGSELCRQAVAHGARKLVLLDLSEYALYAIEMELRRNPVATSCEFIPVLGSAADRELVTGALTCHEVQTLYHAAAYKHVPLVESNAISAVRNNVISTLSVVESCVQAQVENLVLVSTDKAVRPTNVMGASKRICELIVQAYAERSPHTRMSMVRFGNVLASSGSVVPLFREQIRKGGPITVTHPEITRYFMTIPEAAQLVIQAGAIGQHGEVFVLDMGQPVRIRELAERMIRLSGFQVVDPETGRGDIAIKYTGLRPGEKLFEELLIGDNPEGTVHPRIFKAREQFIPWALLKPSVESLCSTTSEEVVLQHLERLVSGFKRSRPRVIDGLEAANGDGQPEGPTCSEVELDMDPETTAPRSVAVVS